jgi:hypothetical protein
MAWFRKSYRCDECEVGWNDEWSCGCNDRCPECDAEIEPFESEDLSVQVELREEGKLWVVLVSPPAAEHKPAHVETRFSRKREAKAFAAEETQRLSELMQAL